MYERILKLYKAKLAVRIALQLVLLLLVYFAIRYWKSIDNISGAAPVIHAQMLSGENFDLREKIKQKHSQPVLVHFWATWCPVCKLENSAIASLAEDYEVVTIASWSEGEVAVREYLKEEELNMPVIIDEHGEWAGLYGVKAVPTSFVIDPQGTIRFIETGYTTELGLMLRLWWLKK